jgi:cytochrome d ubiquinol oxidase subunit II
VAALALVYTRRFQAARFCAAAAVAAIIAGWALARWPTILPRFTVYQAAAGHDTLVWVTVAVLAGATILFPSLGLLFRLTLTGRFQAQETTPTELPAAAIHGFAPRLVVRAAVALLIAGVGLLNVADASWTHAMGVLCLFGFAVAAFLAVIPNALAEQPTKE